MVQPFIAPGERELIDRELLRRAYQTGNTQRPDLREKMIRAELLFSGFNTDDIEKMDLDDLATFAQLQDLRHDRLAKAIARELAKLLAQMFRR